MKILCRHDTQVPGRGIVSRGELIEWPDGGAFPPQVLGNFSAPDGSPLKEPQPPEPLADGGQREPTDLEKAAEQARAEKLAAEELLKRTAALGKQKLVAALDAAGATYPAKATNEELARTLLRAQGQTVD